MYVRYRVHEKNNLTKRLGAGNLVLVGYADLTKGKKMKAFKLLMLSVLAFAWGVGALLFCPCAQYMDFTAVLFTFSTLVLSGPAIAVLIYDEWRG